MWINDAYIYDGLDGYTPNNVQIWNGNTKVLNLNIRVCLYLHSFNLFKIDVNLIKL